MTRSIALALVGVLVLAAVVALSSLSYQGFCFSERRFLTNEELFDAAISESINLYYRPRGADGRPLNAVNVRAYRDAADFRQQHPECCVFVPHNSGIEVQRVTFFDQLRGLAAKTVRVEYVSEYLDSDGQIRAKKQIAQLPASNCGKVINAGY